MARLNEAPLSTENVVALKRRFIRQNRDFAKINSSQSIRIRTLECDVSRLLDENLSLREEVLRLQNKLASAPSFDHANVENIRNQVQSKIDEIGKLVAEFGLSTTSLEEKRIPNPTTWRPAVPNLRLSGQEPRMPTITEDKQFPRRTLEPQEIRALRISDQSNESPDIGPPPVAHFENDGPIVYDQTKAASEQYDDELDEEEEAVPAGLSVNLEARRKRKEIPLKQDTTASVKSTEPSADAVARPIKANAKRKLSERATEDAPISAAKADFQFSRRTSTVTSSREIPIAETTRVLAPEKTMEPARPITSIVRRERKVLGDKSVNISPVKSATTKPGKPKPVKIEPDLPSKEPASDPDRTRRKSSKPDSTVPTQPRIHKSLEPPQVDGPTDLPTIESVQTDITTDPHHPDMQPKTPAAPDLFSPTPSEPSTIHHTDAASNSSNVVKDANLEGPTRPSRRARAQISYAEPSLNTKMRRPGKELVSAVYVPPTGTEVVPGRRLSSIGREDGGGRVASVGRAVVKKEVGAEEEGDGDCASWKNLPEAVSMAGVAGDVSPLGKKSSSSSSSSLHTDKLSSIARSGDDFEVARKGGVSASESAMSALMASRQGKPRARLIEADGADIFEFTGSSSPLNNGNEVGGAQDKATKAAASGRRRHSVMLIKEDRGNLPASAGSGISRSNSTAAIRAGSQSSTMAKTEGLGSRRRSMVL